MRMESSWRSSAKPMQPRAALPVGCGQLPASCPSPSDVGRLEGCRARAPLRTGAAAAARARSLIGVVDAHRRLPFALHVEVLTLERDGVVELEVGRGPGEQILVEAQLLARQRDPVAELRRGGTRLDRREAAAAPGVREDAWQVEIDEELVHRPRRRRELPGEAAR